MNLLWTLLALIGAVQYASGDKLLTINNYQQQQQQPHPAPSNEYHRPAATTLQARAGPIRIQASTLKSTPNNARYEQRYTQSQAANRAATVNAKPTVPIAPGAEGLLPPHRSPTALLAQHQQQLQHAQSQQATPKPPSVRILPPLPQRARYVLLDSYQNPIQSQRLINVYPANYQVRAQFVQRIPAGTHQYYAVPQVHSHPLHQRQRLRSQLNRTRSQKLRLQRLRSRYQNCDHFVDGDEDAELEEEAHVELEPAVDSSTVQPIAESASSSGTSTSTSTTTSTSTSTSTTTTPLPAPTKQYEVRRRPAIQQHFYDVEQKVIVRPVGTAVVELEHEHDHEQEPAAKPSAAPEPTTEPIDTHPEEVPPNINSTETTPIPAPEEDVPIDDAGSETEIIQPIPADLPTHQPSPSLPTIQYEPSGATAIASGPGDYYDQQQPTIYHQHGFEPYPPVYGHSAPHPAEYYPQDIPFLQPGPLPVPVPSPGYIPAAPPSTTAVVYGATAAGAGAVAGGGGGPDEADYAGYAGGVQYAQHPPAVSTTPLPCPPADSELIDPHTPHPNSGGPQADADTDATSADDTSANDDVLFDRPRHQPAIVQPRPLKYSARVDSRTRGASAALAANKSATDTRTNEQRLLDLYAVRGGVTEVDAHPAKAGSKELSNASTKLISARFRSNGQSGQLVRARVISVTPAPDHLSPDYEGLSEQSNVRRVVVSKPFERVEKVEIKPAKQEQQQKQQQQRQYVDPREPRKF